MATPHLATLETEIEAINWSGPDLSIDMGFVKNGDDGFLAKALWQTTKLSGAWI